MEKTIDPKIQPLVDALNSVPEVSSIASCEGHFWRNNHPYVYFNSPAATAEVIAGLLEKIYRQEDLYHWWRLTGMFNGENRLCFILEPPHLKHDLGLIRTFANYVLQRHRIDHDISVLADKIVYLGRQLTGVIQPEKGGSGHDSHCQPNHPIAPPSAGMFSERVGVTATRAWGLDIERNILLTSKTRGCFSLPHATTFRNTGIPATIARLLAVVSLVALAACANNREIQYDGTGTDEMRRSPCVCLPVEYQAPKFKWGAV